MSQNKAELRKLFLDKRKRMQQPEVERRSSFVVKNFVSLSSQSLLDIVFWGGYRALPGEVDFDLQYRRILEVGTPLAFPRMTADNKRIEFYRVTSLDNRNEWDLHPWGISQPKSSQPKVEAGELGGIIVPLLCGDRAGSRIGYGKGYYDCYLEGYQGWKCGIAFDWQVLTESVPTDNYDVPLDFLITETDIVSCSTRSLPVSEKFS